METRCYHGTPHNISAQAVRDICAQGLKYEPALTNNFALAAWHALKNGRTKGTVIVCNVDAAKAKYTFCRSKNAHKKIYKFEHIPCEHIIELLEVCRDEQGMAKIMNRRSLRRTPSV